MREKHKIKIKMKRIALIFLSAMTLMACKDEPVNPDQGNGPTTEDGKNRLSLNIHVPSNSVATYSHEYASTNENHIDSILVKLYEGSILTDPPINETWFKGSALTVVNDTTITIGYEVDNITIPTALRVEVFANREEPEQISDEIVHNNPNGTLAKPFFMSGKGAIALSGASYAGTIHLVRNVAKLRTRVSLNSVSMPDDLGINYAGIKIKVMQTPDSTTLFDGAPALSPTNITGYTERAGYTAPGITGEIRPKDGSGILSPTYAGGQIDSLYLYENLDGSNQKTIVRVTIPTTSPSEGNKSAFYDYVLYTNSITDNNILRNYIYILDIKVRGQSLDPLITLALEKWNDVGVSGDILGTYLTTDVSKIIFDSDGKATVNFSTDAQAVYFDFSGFNTANPSTPLGFGPGFSITPGGGIEPANPALAPDGFKDGQLLLDQRHSDSLIFTLDPNTFPGFPDIDLGGTICMRAGNIVKCFTFAKAKSLTYDAHFIVGEPIGTGITNATVTEDATDNDEPGWLKISAVRLYTAAASTTYTGLASNAAPYLHLNENLTGKTRKGSITITSGGVEEVINIYQLPALRIGRFGHTTDTTDLNIYNADLYTEQLYEFGTLPVYKTTNDAVIVPNNAIYNGRRTAINAFDWAQYSAPLNYQNTLYQAINYCAQKNRISTNTNAKKADSLLWYLPSQAQLMGMWISHESYKNVPTSNFGYLNGVHTPDSISLWSSTNNGLYPGEAQYMSFKYGNLGHTHRTQKYWARCVRNGRSTAPTMIEGSATAPVINFTRMPEDSYLATGSKGDATGNESSSNNRTVYRRLRIATADTPSSPIEWASTACNTYSETGATSGWRLPTQRELQAIWILQNDIKGTFSSFNLLGNDYYWSATSASTTTNNYWVVYGSISNPGDAGNAPHRRGTELSRVRCVREQ